MGYFDTPERRELFQGQLYSCQLLSGINALAQSEEGVRRLESLISEAPGGGYVVQFSGQPPVHVTQEMLADERLAFAAPGSGAPIIEAAFLRMNEERGEFPDPGQLLTGEPTRWVGFSDYDDPERNGNRAYLDTVLTQAAEGNAMVRLATWGSEPREVVDADGRPFTLDPRHAYSATVDQGMLLIENPFDTTQTIRLSPAEASQYFDVAMVNPMPGRPWEIPPALEEIDVAATNVGRMAYQITGDASVVDGTSTPATESEIASLRETTGAYEAAAEAHGAAMPNFFAGWSREDMAVISENAQRAGQMAVAEMYEAARSPAPAMAAAEPVAPAPAESPARAGGMPNFFPGLDADTIAAITGCGQGLCASGVSGGTHEQAPPTDLATPLPDLAAARGVEARAL